MKLLITGGCGFLGSNLASCALERGDELIIFDNLYREGSRQNLQWLQKQGPFRFIYGDIRNQNDITCIIKSFKPEAIFHLAGQVAMTTSIANPRLDFEVNVIGTLNLLEGVRLHSPEAVVLYSSTNKVYGDLEQYRYRETDTRYVCIDKPNGFDEITPLDFHSPYGCSKGAADQYVLDYARIFGLKTVVFRHSSMYGGRQFATFDQGWIGWFCQKAIEIKEDFLRDPFTIAGNGKQVRDVLYAADLNRCYYLAIEKIEDARGRVFNIGGGMDNSLSLLELFNYLEETLGIRVKYQKTYWRVSDQKIFVANIEKAKTILGWEPEVSKRDGLGKMINWTREMKLGE